MNIVAPSIDLARLPGWEERPCRDLPLAVFFGPEDQDEPAREREARECWAKALCGRCPVRAACLADELRFPLSRQYGVRGGMTAEERKAEIRRGRAQRSDSSGAVA